MTLRPPHPTIQARLGERLTDARIRELLDRTQQNLEFLYRQFPIRVDGSSSATIGKGSVGTEELQNGAVTAEKLAPGAVGLDALSTTIFVLGTVDERGEGADGTGFSSEKLATGRYRVAFNEAFSGNAAVLITPRTRGRLYHVEAGATRSSFTIEFTNAAGEARDAEFTFFAAPLSL